MPDIDYRLMSDLEKEAVSRGFRFVTVPITLPLMDISKQLEYAGLPVHLTALRDSLRDAIINTLNAKGA